MSTRALDSCRMSGARVHLAISAMTSGTGIRTQSAVRRRLLGLPTEHSPIAALALHEVQSPAVMDPDLEGVCEPLAARRVPPSATMGPLTIPPPFMGQKAISTNSKTGCRPCNTLLPLTDMLYTLLPYAVVRTVEERQQYGRHADAQDDAWI